MKDEKGEVINSSEICVVCGKPLATESNRMICKECEERNESYITQR